MTPYRISRLVRLVEPVDSGQAYEEFELYSCQQAGQDNYISNWTVVVTIRYAVFTFPTRFVLVRHATDSDLSQPEVCTLSVGADLWGSPDPQAQIVGDHLFFLGSLKELYCVSLSELLANRDKPPSTFEAHSHILSRPTSTPEAVIGTQLAFSVFCPHSQADDNKVATVVFFWLVHHTNMRPHSELLEIDIPTTGIPAVTAERTLRMSTYSYKDNDAYRVDYFYTNSGWKSHRKLQFGSLQNYHGVFALTRDGTVVETDWSPSLEHGQITSHLLRYPLAHDEYSNTFVLLTPKRIDLYIPDWR